jgi:hypothetical protein
MDRSPTEVWIESFRSHAYIRIDKPLERFPCTLGHLWTVQSGEVVFGTDAEVAVCAKDAEG